MYPPIIKETIWRVRNVIEEHPTGPLNQPAMGTLVACVAMLKTSAFDHPRIIQHADMMAEALESEPDPRAKLKLHADGILAEVK